MDSVWTHRTVYTCLALCDPFGVDVPLNFDITHSIDGTNLRYQLLGPLVKTGLSLVQTNAESERSLSINARVVTKERASLGESTIVGLRLAKEGVRECECYQSLTAHQHPCVRAIRYQAKSEQNVRQDLIPRVRHGEAALMHPGTTAGLI